MLYGLFVALSILIAIQLNSTYGTVIIHRLFLYSTGKFLWPGFGENIRVVDWMLRRLNGDDDIAVPSAIGLLPAPGSIDTSGLGDVDMEELFSVPRDYWLDDMDETASFLEKQVGCDLPQVVRDEVTNQRQRIQDMI